MEKPKYRGYGMVMGMMALILFCVVAFKMFSDRVRMENMESLKSGKNV